MSEQEIKTETKDDTPIYFKPSEQPSDLDFIKRVNTNKLILDKFNEGKEICSLMVSSFIRESKDNKQHTGTAVQIHGEPEALVFWYARVMNSNDYIKQIMISALKLSDNEEFSKDSETSLVYKLKAEELKAEEL